MLKCARSMVFAATEFLESTKKFFTQSVVRIRRFDTMGKAKKVKSRPDAIRGDSQLPNANKSATNDLEADLASLDENKRLKACTMLSDLYTFNTNNKMSLTALASPQILSKLTMRLTDSSNNVKQQAAQALHSLSECEDDSVLGRVVNGGLFRAAISLSMDGESMAANNSTFAEQLFFSVANVLTASKAAEQELSRCGTEYVTYLLNLIAPSTSVSVLGAVSHLLAAITSCPASTSFINAEVVISRVWAFIVEVQSYDATRLLAVGLDSPSTLLIQCCEVLCNLFLNPSVAATPEQCQVHEVVVFAAQLLGAGQYAGETSATGPNTCTKLVSSFLLNILESLNGTSDCDGPVQFDIEEARAAAVKKNKDPKRLALLAAMDSAGLQTHFYTALNRVEAGVRAHIAESNVTTLVQSGTGISSSFTSTVISKHVQEGFECLEQLLSATQQYVLFRAVSGTFTLDLPPFVAITQFLLDTVSAFTESVDGSSKAESVVWSYAEGVSENALRDSVLNAAAGLIDFICSACRVGYNSVSGNGAGSSAPHPAASCYLHLNEEVLKGVSLLLMKCSTNSYLELALPAVHAVGVLGQRGDQVVTLHGGVAVKLTLPVSLNALLTNAVLRRCQEPNAYSVDNSSEGSANVTRSTLMLMDACFNAVIDLHSSDDPAFLENFVKLKCIEKLTERGSDFTARVRNQASLRVLDAADREKFDETLENLSNFVAYKQDFIGNK